MVKTPQYFKSNFTNFNDLRKKSIDEKTVFILFR